MYQVHSLSSYLKAHDVSLILNSASNFGDRAEPEDGTYSRGERSASPIFSRELNFRVVQGEACVPS